MGDFHRYRLTLMPRDGRKDSQRLHCRKCVAACNSVGHREERRVSSLVSTRHERRDIAGKIDADTKARILLHRISRSANTERLVSSFDSVAHGRQSER